MTGFLLCGFTFGPVDDERQTQSVGDLLHELGHDFFGRRDLGDSVFCAFDHAAGAVEDDREIGDVPLLVRLGAVSFHRFDHPIRGDRFPQPRFIGGPQREERRRLLQQAEDRPFVGPIFQELNDVVQRDGFGGPLRAGARLLRVLPHRLDHCIGRHPVFETFQNFVVHVEVDTVLFNVRDDAHFIRPELE